MVTIINRNYASKADIAQLDVERSKISLSLNLIVTVLDIVWNKIFLVIIPARD